MTTPTPDVWGVRSLVPAICASCCVAFAAWLVAATAPEDRLVAGVALAVSAIAAAALLTMRRRLTAGSDGLTIRGPAGSRRVSWDQVVAISAPTRQRRGLSSTSVELDLDDEGLIVLGRTELGADPVDVAEALRQWWRLGSDPAGSAVGAAHEVARSGDVALPTTDPGVTDDHRRGDQD